MELNFLKPYIGYKLGAVEYANGNPDAKLSAGPIYNATKNFDKLSDQEKLNVYYPYDTLVKTLYQDKYLSYDFYKDYLQKIMLNIVIMELGVSNIGVCLHETKSGFENGILYVKFNEKNNLYSFLHQLADLKLKLNLAQNKQLTPSEQFACGFLTAGELIKEIDPKTKIAGLNPYDVFVEQQTFELMCKYLNVNMQKIDGDKTQDLAPFTKIVCELGSNPQIVDPCKTVRDKNYALKELVKNKYLLDYYFEYEESIMSLVYVNECIKKLTKMAGYDKRAEHFLLSLKSCLQGLIEFIDCKQIAKLTGKFDEKNSSQLLIHKLAYNIMSEQLHNDCLRGTTTIPKHKIKNVFNFSYNVDNNNFNSAGWNLSNCTFVFDYNGAINPIVGNIDLILDDCKIYPITFNDIKISNDVYLKAKKLANKQLQNMSAGEAGNNN